MHATRATLCFSSYAIKCWRVAHIRALCSTPRHLFCKVHRNAQTAYKLKKEDILKNFGVQTIVCIDVFLRLIQHTF